MATAHQIQNGDYFVLSLLKTNLDSYQFLLLYNNVFGGFVTKWLTNWSVEFETTNQVQARIR